MAFRRRYRRYSPVRRVRRGYGRRSYRRYGGRARSRSVRPRRIGFRM